jgi:hypothetical protein
MKIIGGLLIAFGIADVGGSYAGVDVWGDWIGVQLPEAIWNFTGYIELGLGYLLFKMGSGGEPEADTSPPA